MYQMQNVAAHHIGWCTHKYRGNVRMITYFIPTVVIGPLP